MEDRPYAMLIGGALVAGAEAFEILNPATEQPVALAPDCTAAELDAAVAAARAAFPSWTATAIDERRAILHAIADRLEANAAMLARILTSEQGKPHPDAEREIRGAAANMRLTATLDLPVNVVEDTSARTIETRHVPIGVVAGIAPWNFPIALGIMKVAPALLAGNTLVLKPSPFTPLATLKLGEIVRDIVPAGVLNVISGSDRLGPWLTGHRGIDKISFTGSTQTGRRVMESASHSLKRVTLELGGNDAAIVLPDIDVAALAEQLFWIAFRNAGQVCVAAKRFYIHEDIYDDLAKALAEYAGTVKVGNGAEQGTQIGPVNNRPQYQRVLDLLADAKAKGYRFLVGGDASEAPGYFVPVSILDNPPEDARIVQEEQFGPVVPLMKYRDVDDVVARVNATEYGLGNTIWSNDIDRAMEIANRLESGMVWINEAQIVHPLASFGGHKQSGLGSEGGVEGLLAYTVTKTVVVRKPTSVSA